MTYKQIKWMILFVPTLIVGLWEYVRHQFLMPYISMDLGNWLTPVLVYLVSVTLLNQLFSLLEKIQQELQTERAQKAALEAREQLAKELHDGIAQSLFLLSVKVDQLEFTADTKKHEEAVYTVRKTVHEVNRYVRQAIANLRYSTNTKSEVVLKETLEDKVKIIADEVLIPIEIDWNIPEEAMNPREKVEILACIREAVVNIQKHARATKGWILAQGDESDWKVTIQDNGEGFREELMDLKDSYGLNIMKDRADDMRWQLRISNQNERTTLELQKTGGGA
ncbi:two-component system nitrate/nitrite sensor histidine kinase NarQ [Fontibacillus phaseoli]|uniref:histidine kinase n=1 Tax=Fontibacillus phaseoli TaxID=1416533 RepID=A0A369BQR8_9BACL|nr:histidine kinase [Fontibacillus phaseoli]RCX23741.1 two-component system nitrate/nitrite sensor histidine kinase NarQ [Fontibacillus phaseoli]